jgi:uncharacterized protein (TIGR00299 family) protein
VHHTTPEQVHFHEVGAVDSIVDVAGTAWCLDQLGIGEVLVSAIPAGSGFARSQHGIIPVPAPATAELLAGFHVRLGDGSAEMITPTGAAVLRALARPAELPLGFEIERIGYGAGTREMPDRPNVLRAIVGARRASFDSDELLEIAANIDDLNPQIYEHVMEVLFAAGARDVTITPTIMKKARPAITITVLAEPALRDNIARILFAETSTIGLRFNPVARLKLRREIKQVETKWGPVRVKISEGAAIANVAPEYDDCRKIASASGIPLKTVMEDARHAAAHNRFVELPSESHPGQSARDHHHEEHAHPHPHKHEHHH